MLIGRLIIFDLLSNFQWIFVVILNLPKLSNGRKKKIFFLIFQQDEFLYFIENEEKCMYSSFVVR